MATRISDVREVGNVLLRDKHWNTRLYRCVVRDITQVTPSVRSGYAVTRHHGTVFVMAKNGGWWTPGG